MLEKGTLVVIEWLSYNFLHTIWETFDQVRTKKPTYATGWVLKDSKKILTVVTFKSDSDDVQLHIDKEDITKITIFADAKDCPF